MSRCLLYLYLIFCACGLHAETLTIESAVTRALRSNPDLTAARWSIEEARARVWNSGRLANPELDAEVKPNVMGREFTFSVGFMQKFPRTNRLHLERAVSQAELAVAESEVKNAARLLASEVRTAAVKLLAVQSRKALKEQQRKTSVELAADADHATKAGEGSPLDAAHFELEVQQFSLDLLTADAESASLTAALRPLLGLSVKESLTISGELPAPYSSGKGASPSNRGDYQAAVAKETAARTGIDLARARKWDDATYGLTYEREHSEDAGYGMKHENFIGFKFSLPLPFWNKNEGKVREAEATAARAAKEREALALKIHSEADAARAEMTAAAKIIEQTSGPLLTKAKDLEERHTAANKLGQSPLADVLRSREMRFKLEEARLTALRDWHLARVRLLAAQGR